MKVRWSASSWLLVQSPGHVIYIDPAWIPKNFLRYPGRLIFSRYPQPMDGLPEADLPLADLIVITHAHKDHYKQPTVERLIKPETVILAPERLAGTFSIAVSVVQAGDNGKSDHQDQSRARIPHPGGPLAPEAPSPRRGRRIPP